MSNEDFYRALEDKLRGSRSVIKSRLEIYLEFVLKLKEIYPGTSALDIGCGRGEWLELLKENGFIAQGIDFDAGMLDACYELGLDVLKGNGIEFIKQQESNSRIIISGFHVAEHISFDELQELIKESLRVLKPGGMLILETPNPENIKVGTEKFYLDPTHLKPIPCELLSFMAEFHGYARSKVLRLQESKKIASQSSATLLDVLEGTSPDYAVVAQKEAKQEIIECFDSVFSLEFGLSLNNASEKFEYRLLKIEIAALEAKRATEDTLKVQEKIINNMVKSTSWRITSPFRFIMHCVKLTVVNPKELIPFVISHLNAFPKIKGYIKKLITKLPFLNFFLIYVASLSGKQGGDPKIMNSKLTPRQKTILKNMGIQ